MPEAEKLAIAASNSAAITAARDSIDKILADNSDILSDLEITSLISNNLSTTVVVFNPIALSSVATTTDGINYTLVKDTVIESDQWLTVPNGKTFTTGNYHFTNNGYFQIGELPSQIGEPSGSDSKTLKETDAQTTYSADASNNGYVVVDGGCSCTIDTGVTFQNSASGAEFTNYGKTYNYGTILNSESNTSVTNCDPFYNYGTIINSGSPSYISNKNNFDFYNYSGASVENSGDSSGIINSGVFNNESGAIITNSGTSSYIQQNGANGSSFTNDGIIINTGSASSVTNAATFNNNSFIYNNASYSYVSNNETFNNNNLYSFIYNNASYSYVSNNGTFNNNNAITNRGSYSYVVNNGTFNNSAISNNASYSYVVNNGTFNNNGFISNEGEYSYFQNSSGGYCENYEDASITNEAIYSHVVNATGATFYNYGVVYNYISNTYTENNGTWTNGTTGSVCANSTTCPGTTSGL